MSLESTRFIGWAHDGEPRLPYDRILERHTILRDTIATTLAGDPDAHQNLWGFVALQSFTYIFNVYKAIGLILPEHYHESGAVILRQLWEVSMILHWIERDPESRAQDFCNFTVMEMRRAAQLTGDEDDLADLDEATERFQTNFRFQDRRGRDRTHPNFSTATVRDRAEELGEPWSDDYRLIYHLSSMHAHGAPGAVLHQHFVQHSVSPETREKDSTALIAYLSMKTIVDDVHLLVRQGFAADSEEIDKAFDGVLDPPESDNTE